MMVNWSGNNVRGAFPMIFDFDKEELAQPIQAEKVRVVVLRWVHQRLKVKTLLMRFSSEANRLMWGNF